MKFNPDIPDVAPGNYTQLSKPIEQPQADKTLGTLFQGIGSTLESGLKGTDEVFKATIQDQLYDRVDKYRQGAIDNYSQFGKDVKGNASLPGYNDNAQATAEDMPDELNDLGNNVQTLSDGKSSGKISLSQYWLGVDSIAKDMRSRFPGYKEYIDQTISTITGHNPANALFASTIQDLNRSLSSKQDPVEKLAYSKAADFAAKGGADGKGDPFGYKLIEGLQNKTLTPVQVFKHINESNAVNYNAARARDALEGRTAVLGQDKITADEVAKEQTTNISYSELNRFKLGSGLTMAETGKNVLQMVNGEVPYDPVAIKKLGLQYQGGIVVMGDKIRSYLTTPGADGLTLAARAVGPNGDIDAYVDKMIAYGTQTPRAIAGLLQKGDPGSISLATLQAQEMEAQATNDRYNGLKTDYGKRQRMMAVIKDDTVAMREFTKDTLGKEYGSPNINQFVKDMYASFQTQPDAASGHIITPSEAIAKANAAGVTNPEVYKDFAEYGKKITNRELPEDKRVAIAYSMFHTNNLNFLKNFNEDHWETAPNGKQILISGKYKVWKDYTSNDVVQAVKELSATHPEVAKMYKNWTETAVGSDLFGPVVRDMNGIAADPRVKLTYDNTNYELKVKEGGEDFNSRYARRIQGGTPGPVNILEDKVDKFNQAIQGLARASGVNIKDAKPETINGYIWGLMKGMGFDVKEMSKDDPKTVADQAVRAFTTSATEWLKKPFNSPDQWFRSTGENSRRNRSGQRPTPPPTPAVAPSAPVAPPVAAPAPAPANDGPL